MLALVCAFLILGAATMVMLFVLPGRRALSESRARRLLVAGVVALAFGLLTLLVDSVMTTTVYRVANDEASIATPLPRIPFVNAAALVVAIVTERAIVWSRSRRRRAQIVAALGSVVAITLPLVIGARQNFADLVDLPPQVADVFPHLHDATTLPAFHVFEGDLLLDLERSNCGRAPRIDSTALSAHHCTILHGHTVSQIRAAVALRPDRWLTRICTRREDTGATRCSVTIAPSFEAEGVLDDAWLPEAQRIAPAADVTAYFEPRLGAWIVVDWKNRSRFSDANEPSLTVMIFDDVTLVPRDFDVTSRELVPWTALVTARWLWILVPAALIAMGALFASRRRRHARWQLESSARRTPSAFSPYRHGVATGEDEQNENARLLQLSKCTLGDERSILLAIAAASACALPLIVATLAHAGDRFPAPGQGGGAAHGLETIAAADPVATPPMFDGIDGESSFGFGFCNLGFCTWQNADGTVGHSSSQW